MDRTTKSMNVQNSEKRYTGIVLKFQSPDDISLAQAHNGRRDVPAILQ